MTSYYYVRTASDTARPKAAPKRDIDAIIAWLDSGLTLSYQSREGLRTLVRGQVTRDRNKKGSVRTTHLSQNLGGYVWLTKAGIAALAAQVRRDWHRMPELIADREAAQRRFLDHQ